MKLFTYSTLALALMLATFSCKNSDNSSSGKDTTGTTTTIAPKKGDFKAEVTLLKDSTEFYWNGIQEMTQQKYKDMSRLLDEISYTEKPNTIELTKCRAKLKEVSAMKLDQHTMKSEEIDRVDYAEDSLIARCISLASTTPGIEQHPLVNTLITDINTANGEKLVTYRARYDFFAKQLNEVIEKDKKKLDKLGAPYDQLTQYKYFSIGL